MKKEKLFNVIIPTRERADTLLYSLKTAVLQDYENLNIIVSDNFSQDNTKDAVASIIDKRIKYINTGKRVSMSHNWEFALSHVKDGYVFFMGDDDGLLPNAVKKANQLLVENGPDAITWKKASYLWPNYIHENAQNTVAMTLTRGFQIRNCKQMLERICNFDFDPDSLCYEHLPGLYNSFVSITAINNARSRSGRFFCSSQPDIYSALALTSSVKNYIYSFGPLSINGASGHSNGTSYFENPKLKAATQYLSEENIPFHDDLLLAPSVPLLVAESVWQVRDNVPGCQHYDVNIEKLFTEARRLSATLSEESRALVYASLERLHNARQTKALPTKEDAYAPLTDNRNESTVSSKIQSKLKQFRNYIISYEKKLTGREVSNVYEASLFCEKLEAKRRRIIFSRALSVVLRKALRGIRSANPFAQE